MRIARFTHEGQFGAILLLDMRAGVVGWESYVEPAALYDIISWSPGAHFKQDRTTRLGVGGFHHSIPDVFLTLSDLCLLNVLRAMFWQSFLILAFGAVAEDFRLSRRHGWIREARKMPNGVPRDLWLFWELFSES